MFNLENAVAPAGFSRIRTLMLLTFLSQTATALAHDFWLEPQYFQISGDDIMQVDIRNGENFSGKVLPFSRSAFKSISVFDKDGPRSVLGEHGGTPAIREAPRDKGLQILSYVSQPTTLVHQSFDEFADFTREEGIDWVLKFYSESESSQRRITERFMRFAKALISVDSTGGNDLVTGMEFELLARDDPYQQLNVDPISIQVLYQQKPLEGIQVTVHQRRVDGNTIKRSLLSDEHGRVVVSKEPGSTYLVNAVHIRKPGAFQRFLNDTDWETLWASLTFQVPSLADDQSF